MSRTPSAKEVEELVKSEGSQCLMSWQLDGRQMKASASEKAQSVQGSTRRIHLQWNDKRLKDAYLVFVAPERYTMTPSDAQRVWGEEQLFMGRKIDTEAGIQARIKSWLDLCKTQHHGPCSPMDEDVHSDVDVHPGLEPRFMDMLTHSYFGLVDVNNMQLVGFPTRTEESGLPPFAALSYVWGKTLAYRTTTENVLLLRTHGGIEKVLKQLPTVITDAIDLTRRLGLQYIWIDALCIVQDSPRSWSLNANNMDIIYGNAELTICAADGEDASVGLRAMKMEDHNGEQLMAECAPGIRLVVSRPPEMYIKTSKWNTRAWTFQERLMSNRCLIFTAGRVYFQCRSTGMSEDIYADREGAGWSLDFVDAPMQMYKQLSQRAFWVYTKILTLYTQRDLTKSEDILAAFSGTRNSMANTMRAPFIFGLPSSHFDLALLWQHNMPVTRREAANAEQKRERRAADFPSWCWSGWQGAPAGYLTDMVGDCLDNVNEWLDTHTWIKWHIRDGRGDLRPLWDAHDWAEDVSEDKRWRGYNTQRSTLLPSTGVTSGGRRGKSGDYFSEENDPDENRPERPVRRYAHQYRGYPRHPANSAYPYGDPYDDPYGYSGHTYPPADARFLAPPYDPYYNPPWPGPSYHYAPPPLPPHRAQPRASPSSTKAPPPAPRPAPLPAPSPTGPGHTSEFYNQFFAHGRHANPEAMQANPTFKITLRDYPYNVVMAPFDPNLDRSEYPPMPFLQFWTHHMFLYIRTNSSESSEGLVRCHIGDSNGDWCGSIVLDEKWVKSTSSARQEFIAISEAKKFAREECDIWTYYIPKEREQSESEWDLYYVLLIERKEEKWERIGLGKVFKEAFRKSTWKEIMLG
ncbi:MAG: hypothetical protein M1822_003971 [Bathelium mastoideum]|nr:MAG: hypothetical protein M1822_003971 [Bathelium mastoideum]